MAAYQITNDRRAAHDLAIKAMRPLRGSATLVNVNDVRGHAAVLALFDEVIAAGLEPSEQQYQSRQPGADGSGNSCHHDDVVTPFPAIFLLFHPV